MINPELLPPFPDTLEKCHREIQYLKEQLHIARTKYAEQVVTREKDRRANTGNSKAIVEKYRNAMESLNKINATLEEFGIPMVNDKNIIDYNPDAVYNVVRNAMDFLFARNSELYSENNKLKLKLKLKPKPKKAKQ